MVGCGVATIILSYDKRVVLGERLAGHSTGSKRRGVGKYGLPGGALEKGETLEECAFREIEEETGLERWKFSGIKQLFAVAHKLGKDASWVTIYVHATLNNPHFSRGLDSDTILKNTEPEKCAGWELVSHINAMSLSDKGLLFGGKDTLKAISSAMMLRG